MNPFSRTISVLRLLVAEVSTVKYLLSAGLYLAFLVAAYTMSNLSDQSVMQGEYLVVSSGAIAGCVTLALFISILSLALGGISKWFKEEPQSVAFLTLPATNGERFTAILLFGFVFIPLITILPILLVSVVGYAVAPGYMVLPPLQALYPHIWKSYASCAGICAVALLPVIAAPKRLGWGVVLFCLLIPAYAYLTRTYLKPEPAQVFFESNAFKDTDVVGLYSSGTLTEASPLEFTTYGGDYGADIPGLVMMLFFIGLILVGYLALTKKTT